MSFSAKNDDGAGFGLKGENATPPDLGHLHEAGVIGTSQGGVGVFGTSGDIASLGIFGSADIGVQGASPDGTGAAGHSRTGRGVAGDSDASDGVRGVSRTGVGVFGISSGLDGVHGESQQNGAAGVFGLHTGTEGRGVQGTGSAAGVGGFSETGIGVLGQSNGGDGVQGITNKTGNSGVAGVATNGANGVFGQSDTGRGINGVSNGGDGVFGQSSGKDRSGVTAFNTGGGRGLTAVGSPAGHFDGDVEVTGHFKNPGTNAPAVFGESDAGDGVFGLSKASGRSGVTAFNEGGGRGLTAVGSPAGHFDGDVEVTGDIRLFGGQDCAEDFDIVNLKDAEPGTVMVLEQNGALEPSSRAYDKKVAGVISGAGDFRPGIILGKQKSESTRMPVALLGKVYCKADAQYSPIEIGDLLTTSLTPGHAMKAEDPQKAFGAVIGKALSPLNAGQGMIPILIALQ